MRLNARLHARVWRGQVSEVQETSQVRDKPRYNKHRYASVGDRSNDGPNDRYSDRRGGSRQQLRGGDEWGSDRPRGERPYYNKRRDSGDGGDRRGRREGGDNTRE